MTSQNKADASRANGAKSKGPKTPEGKARSAQNSRRHGSLANIVVLIEENPEAFQALMADLDGRLRPQDIVEAHLVETMAVAQWRQERLWAMEKGGLDYETSKNRDWEMSPSVRASLAFRAASGDTAAADLLGRYDTRFDRQYHRALNQLIRYRLVKATAFPEPDSALTPEPENQIPNHPEPQPETVPGPEPSETAAAPQPTAPRTSRQETRRQRSARRRREAKMQNCQTNLPSQARDHR